MIITLVLVVIAILNITLGILKIKGMFVDKSIFGGISSIYIGIALLTIALLTLPLLVAKIILLSMLIVFIASLINSLSI